MIQSNFGFRTATMPTMPEILSNLRISDLREFESALQIKIECFKTLLEEKSQNNVLWLLFAPVGMKLAYKKEFLSNEVRRCENLLERVRLAIVNY